MSSTFVLSKDAETVAECFSAHYTNIFLIYLYSEARKYVEKEANVHSLTDGYKIAMAAYNNAMSKGDFVKQTLHGIYNQFVKIDKTMRNRECISKILRAFYPEDGYKGIIKQEKLIELAISKIIHDVTKQIIYTVPVKHAKSIIDANEKPQTQNLMQDEFTQIVLELMERNHIEYLGKKKSQYHHPSTDHAMFEKAKDELSKLNSEKSELMAKHGAIIKQLNDLQLMNNDLREKVGNQQGRIKELENQLSRAQSSYSQSTYSPPALSPQYSVRRASASPMQPTYTPSVQPTQPTYTSGGGGGGGGTATFHPEVNRQTPDDSSQRVSDDSSTKAKRDYSHLLTDVNSDSDNDDEEPEPPSRERNKEILSRINDEDEISLNMFSK